jgi:adenine-specific DNA-methyltransferase
MARKKTHHTNSKRVRDFRHTEAQRKNNPPAGIAPTYEMRQRQTTRYQYDPHLDPQLVWAGKAEHTSFEVELVSLHIHERISTKAILKAVRRPEPIQPTLFCETPLPADKEVQFYQHEVGWANRLILGDSLLVMNSLLVKEGMAGKVQMIYVDPPYGIKYASNFQPRIDRRDVKDKDEDLTHEPEQNFEQTVGVDLWQRELVEKFHLDAVVVSSAIMLASPQHALELEEVRRELEVILSLEASR